MVDTDDESVKETTSWRKSIAKRMLCEEIANGTVTEGMDWKVVFESKAEYRATKKRLFEERLKRLCKRFNNSKNNAEYDEQGLEHDRQMFPSPAQNYRGEPQWEGSEAQAYLRQDITAGLHNTHTPMDLWLSRDEYHLFFPQGVFREHIYQEVRCQKYWAWRNEKKKPRAEDYF